jgi:hypothetical protein
VSEQQVFELPCAHVREVRALGSKVRALGSKIRKKNFLFFFTQEMLARVLEVAKARCKQIWAPVKENDADIPQLESAELVAASARALTAAKEFAKATASAAVAATKSRETKPNPGKRKGEPRGHYSRKPKALKVEFRQIFYAHGVEEAVASMADKGVPESTARGWADPKELAKPLPVDGKNRPGAGRAPAYSLEQLRPVYDKASERKHLVGRVDDRYLRRVCKTDLPTVDGYDMQFTRPYLRGKAKAFGFSFGETTPAKPSDIVKDPETVRRELRNMFAEAFQWRLEYFTKHYPGSALSLEPMCTGNRLFYFDELGQSLEAGAGPLMNTMFRKDETNEEGERETRQVREWEVENLLHSRSHHKCTRRRGAVPCCLSWQAAALSQPDRGRRTFDFRCVERHALQQQHSFRRISTRCPRSNRREARRSRFMWLSRPGLPRLLLGG